MQTGKTHELLRPICWLIGKWRSTQAEVKYPKRSCPIIYEEIMNFVSVGQPVLGYTSVTWDYDSKKPMHLENGFLLIDADGHKVALVCANNAGVSTVEEGIVKNKQMIINTTCMEYMSFVKPEKRIISLHRHYKLNEYGTLEYTTMIEYTTAPLTDHIKATFEKCE